MFWTSYTYLGVSFGRVFWYFPEPDNEQCLARRSADRVAEWQSGRVALFRFGGRRPAYHGFAEGAMTKMQMHGSRYGLPSHLSRMTRKAYYECFHATTA
jgi:hypothetical protein